MIWILYFLVFIPCVSFSMDDELFDSVSSSDNAHVAATSCFINLNKPDTAEAQSGCSSTVIGANQQASATPFVTPRTARSNSIYVAACQAAQNSARSSREVISVDGLQELAEGVDEASTVQPSLTDSQVAQYFFKRLNGKNLPGIGLFSVDDKNQCAELRGLIGIIKRVSPDKYARMARNINRGRSSRYSNNDLIEVLTKVVGSINSLNENSTHVAKEQHEAVKLQLEIMERRLKTEQDALALAQQSNTNTTRRYRMTTLWTLIGGGITVVVTNLLQHFLSNNGAMDMSGQMQNTTMS